MLKFLISCILDTKIIVFIWMNKNSFAVILAIFCLQASLVCAWQIDDDYTTAQSPLPSSAMAFVRGVLVSAGGSKLQFRSGNKDLLKEHTLDGAITSIVVQPILDSEYVLVSTTAGTIYTFNPPGFTNQYEQAHTKTMPYDTIYANTMLWAGNSKIVAAGTSRAGFPPQYYIYEIATNGSLLFKSATTTSFVEDTDITHAAINSDYSLASFYSPNNFVYGETNGTVNQSLIISSTTSNIQEYSLSDNTISNKFDDTGLSDLANAGQLAYVGNEVYLFDKVDKKLYHATALNALQQNVNADNSSKLVMENIKQSIYIDQIVIQTRDSQTNKLYVNYFKPTSDGKVQEIAYIQVFDRDGKTVNTIAFNEGMTQMGLGYQNAGQQTYGGGTPVAAYVVPIAVILGVGLITGVALLIKGGGKGLGKGKGKEFEGGESRGSMAKDEL